MSDEKPFAEATPGSSPGTSSRWSLRVGPVENVSVIDAWRSPDSQAALIQAASLINMAVEQREAKLRHAFVALRQSLVDAMVAIEHPERTPSPWSILEAGRRNSLAAFNDIESAPPMVPAAELAAEKAKVKQLQAAIDALDARESLTAAEVVAMLEANGLKKPSDTESLRRLVRSGRVVVHPPPIVRCTECRRNNITEPAMSGALLCERHGREAVARYLREEADVD